MVASLVGDSGLISDDMAWRRGIFDAFCASDMTEPPRVVVLVKYGPSQLGSTHSRSVPFALECTLNCATQTSISAVLPQSPLLGQRRQPALEAIRVGVRVAVVGAHRRTTYLEIGDVKTK